MQRSLVFTHLLNFYDVLLLTTFILACVLAFPLILKRERREHDLLLALFVLSQGFYALYSVLLYSETIGPHTKSLLFPFQNIPFLFILGTQGLLLWWYARAMMGFAVSYRGKYAISMLSLTVFAVLLSTFLSYQLHSVLHIWIGGAWLLSLGSLVLGFKALRQLRGYELQLPFIHSSMLRHSLTWLKIVAIGFVSVWVMTVLAMFADVVGERGIAHGLYLTRHIPPLVLIAAMVVYSQTHAITRQPDLSTDEDGQNLNNDAAAYAVNQKLALQLDDLMNRVRVYKDPELRLERVSRQYGHFTA